MGDKLAVDTVPAAAAAGAGRQSARLCYVMLYSFDGWGPTLLVEYCN